MSFDRFCSYWPSYLIFACSIILGVLQRPPPHGRQALLMVFYFAASLLSCHSPANKARQARPPINTVFPICHVCLPLLTFLLPKIVSYLIAVPYYLCALSPSQRRLGVLPSIAKGGFPISHFSLMFSEPRTILSSGARLPSSPLVSPRLPSPLVVSLSVPSPPSAPLTFSLHFESVS